MGGVERGGDAALLGGVRGERSRERLQFAAVRASAVEVIADVRVEERARAESGEIEPVVTPSITRQKSATPETSTEAAGCGAAAMKVTERAAKKRAASARRRLGMRIRWGCPRFDSPIDSVDCPEGRIESLAV